jgi:TolB protein
MPEIQEVFRMATQKVRPDPEALDRQHRGQRRRVTQKRAAVYALVVVLVVAGAVVAISTLGSDHEQPAGDGSKPPRPETAQQTLSIVDVLNGTATEFTAPAEASGFDFTLDASKVTYVDVDENGNTQVFVMDADGSNVQQLTHGEGARQPDWSPDGSMIAYEQETSDGPQIFTVRISDGVSTRVTNEPEGAVDPGGWAPDGGSIVFSASNAAGNRYTARSVDLTSGQTSQIVPNGSTPTLSPDGAWIAFNSWSKEPTVQLILANSDGSAGRTIARFTLDDGYQQWSPDSTHIAFVDTTDADGSGTYVYDLTTGETRFVTSGTIESWLDNAHFLVS